MSKDLIAAITLEAMARNYANGNLWDDLDREAVCEAARVIREQEAEIERLRGVLFEVASHFQGGHSDTGSKIADLLGAWRAVPADGGSLGKTRS